MGPRPTRPDQGVLQISVKKKRDSEGIVLIPIRRRELICPNCGQETTVTTPMEPVFSEVIFLKVGCLEIVTCQKCNKVFLIEIDKLKKRAA